MQLSHLIELTFQQTKEISEEIISEIVAKEDLTDLDDVIQRLQHCKKALALANKLEDPADRKKWKSSALANMNRVKAAVIRIIMTLEDK